ncbi:MAG TPA: DegT/DnrJ/EryC1/StrS family aminotransferase [Bryobacteraceae bacterium]|nr:DegT/DnrJ/EryC1/StrS family aminotransferase [Bryobacteraceae bacterium]
MILANDFQRQWQEIGQDARDAFQRVGASGWYVLGQEVFGFEQALASRWGLEHAIAVGSGLDAIEISLRALGCGPGDRVLTTPVSAFATTLAIVKLGAVPVFVDTDEGGLLDLDRCRELLRRRPDIRFFVPVHLFGHALDMAALRSLREEFGLKMVEDCAQSIGATFRGEPTGLAGQLPATNFYPTKNLGAMGDGGAILTRDPSLGAQVRALRDYGQSAKYLHEYAGYNSRLDELQAAFLRHACLPRLEQWTRRRREIARAYMQGIRQAKVRVVPVPEGSESCWHLFPVCVAGEGQSAFLKYMRTSGVTAGIHYPVAIPDQPALAKTPFELAGDGAIARRFCASEASLPIHPYLTEAEVDQVVCAVNAW